MRRRQGQVATRLTARGAPLLSTLLCLLPAALLPSAALAHPSGLPTKGPGQYTVATSADWLFWDFHPSIITGIVIMTALYTWALRVGYRKWGVSEPISKARTRTFYGSMVLLWFTLDGPLHHLSDELLFSAHMVQHLSLQLVWAALFVWSVPVWMWQRVLKNRAIRRIAYAVTRPLPAFFIYNGATWFWHWPAMYDLALKAHNWHIVEHLMFMSTACIFWWPLVGGTPEVPRPTYGRQMFYVFFNMLAMKALGIAISMQDAVIYTWYETVPRVWGLTALGDRRDAVVAAGGAAAVGGARLRVLAAGTQGHAQARHDRRRGDRQAA